MKILIASDLHGSARYCRALLEAVRREEADRVLRRAHLRTALQMELSARDWTPEDPEFPPEE